MDSHQRTLENVVFCVGDLPALPSVVADVLKITDDPAAAMSQICECIQRDPALTAKILKISNSPYYGMKQYVGTLKLALVILGVREVRNIVLGVSVFESLCDKGVDSILRQDFWEHSMRVAALSKMLGSALSLGLQGEDFISGLLHDVGKMVLLNQLGPSYRQLFRKMGGSGDKLAQAEMDMFGFDHADAAAALSLHWNLPKTLTDTVGLHHNNANREISKAKDPKLAAVVRIANLAVRDDFETAEAECASCLDEEAWNVLAPKAPKDYVARKAMLCDFMVKLSEVLSLSL